MKAEFEKKLYELGLSYQINPEGSYILSLINDVERTITVRLIFSELVNPLIYGSHNNNEVESIGLFKFKLNPAQSKSDFIIFDFRNSIKQQTEFVIIPTDELNKRLTKEDRTCIGNYTHKIVFWLMPDGFIYNCTDIGIEGEWYFMSKGINGRLADRSDWNYTFFLNNWDILMKIKSSPPTID
jgi:hypothetical protein